MKSLEDYRHILRDVDSRIIRFHTCFFFLVYKMQERHDILTRTIGYLDEEQEALNRGYLLLLSSTYTMVVGSLLQILFFYLYNGPFHPFANILVDETEG